jgi:hypothetical protein
MGFLVSGATLPPTPTVPIQQPKPSASLVNLAGERTSREP